MKNVFFQRSAKRQKGVSLVEAMVAFVVAGFGMLAMVGVQSTLRSNADIAKQRTEAVRLAQRRMEDLRSFPTLATYAAITSPQTERLTVGNETYEITQSVLRRSLPNPDRLELAVRVAWQDRLSRTGSDSEVVLASAIAGIDPALSGWLTAPLPPVSRLRPLGRHPSIPLQAVDFGDGRSGFVPPRADGVAWVFNNQTGLVTVCAVSPGTLTINLTVQGLTSCGVQTGYLVSGHVRFATAASQPTAADAEQSTSLAMNLDMGLQLTLGSAPTHPCYDDAPEAETLATSVAYYCLVYGAGDSGKWSGRVGIDLVGRTLIANASGYRVCRYTADYDGNRSVTNEEHPDTYTAVGANLVNQNFLIVSGQNICPVDSAANAGAGDFVNANTVEQAPTRTVTPVARS